MVISQSKSHHPLQGSAGDKPEQQGHSACIFYNVLDSFSRNVATTEEEGACSVKCCDHEGAASNISGTSPDWRGMGWYR